MQARGRKLAGFVLEELLGRGGMGEVWRAVDPVLRRRVAIKVLRREAAADAELRARFLREGRALAAVAHPNIVTVLRAEEESGVALLAMELLEGTTLRVALTARPPLASRLAWLVQIARALEAMHEAGLVHRDLKPENVFITRFGAKVLDLGIASTTGTEIGMTADVRLTATGAVIGTPRYMAPEQWRGAEAEATTDQFAFGILAYELLALRHPETSAPGFGGTADLTAAPTPLATLVPDLPFGLSAIVTKLLGRSPADRFASMHDVIAALEPLAKPGEDAPPVRPRRGLIFALAFCASLVVGLVAALVFVLRGGLEAPPRPATVDASVPPPEPVASSGAHETPPEPSASAAPEPTVTRKAPVYDNVPGTSIDTSALLPAFDEASVRAWKAAVDPALKRCVNSQPIPDGCPPDMGDLTLAFASSGKITNAYVSSRGFRRGLVGPFCHLKAIDRCALASVQLRALKPAGEVPTEPVKLRVSFD